MKEDQPSSGWREDLEVVIIQMPETMKAGLQHYAINHRQKMTVIVRELIARLLGLGEEHVYLNDAQRPIDDPKRKAKGNDDE